jgi:hypothetical protein
LSQKCKHGFFIFISVMTKYVPIYTFHISSMVLFKVFKEALDTFTHTKVVGTMCRILLRAVRGAILEILSKINRADFFLIAPT